MRKLSFMLITIMIMILILAVVPAAASSPPLDVVIEVEENLAPYPPAPFVASGPAVSEGLICQEGGTTDDWVRVNGAQSQQVRTLQVLKRFVCNDGSGEFFVMLQVRFDRTGEYNTIFQWVIVGGNGDYENLHGSGSGVGVPAIGEYDVLDIYEGQIH